MLNNNKKSLPPHFSLSLIPKNIFQRLVRLIYMFISFFRSFVFRSSTKIKIIESYREFVSMKMGIVPIEINSLTDWNNLELKLISPTSNAGQVSHLELLSIIGLAKSFLKPGQNFLEIGTFDGNTAHNVAINIPQVSKVITMDLPEDTSEVAKFAYDDYLVKSKNRSKKKHLHLKNVEQIYHNSTTYDFDRLTFNFSFIDGGHDYETVKSDTLNVLKYIQRPGIILWHDYDVECEIGDLLHALAKEHSIKWIKGTRLAYLKLEL
jgi:hypothetical protein